MPTNKSDTCPICGRPLPDEPVGDAVEPFCSERCKLADLGSWFDGRYAIPTDDPPPPDPASDS